jgi:hypothetical protein
MIKTVEAYDLHCFVPNVTFEQIPIKNLVSNQQYQRNLSMGHVKRVASQFDLYQINPVKVSRRNGVNYVFNGQHTIETVALVSGSRDTPVWCMVYDNIDYEEEADIFANQMRFTKPLTPYEIFLANIEAGNDKQLIIKGLVDSYHLFISAKKMQNNICAISALEYIHDKYGYHVLEHVLRLCVGAWEGDPQSLSANVIKGLALIIVAFGDELKDDMFVDKLGRCSAKEIIRTAKDRRAGSIGYAEAILLLYNHRMKFPLKMDKLYMQQKENETHGAEDTHSDLLDLIEMPSEVIPV